ncbi:NAD-dependent epimerase/dehydratase, partial [mine drainage metagenome]
MDIDGKPDYKISITDRDALRGIREKFDCIFHLAAVTSPPQFEKDPEHGLYVNINGTFNVLDYAFRTGTRKVVIASSSAIYGDSPDISVEGNHQDAFRNLYPVTKVTDEYLARYFSIRGDLECVALRYFNTFGSGENTKGLYSSPIHKFLLSAMRSEDIDVYGDGTQSRDFIYIKDSVK